MTTINNIKKCTKIKLSVFAVSIRYQNVTKEQETQKQELAALLAEFADFFQSNAE